MSELTIEEQVKVIQEVLYENYDYPNTVVKPKHVPYIPLKQEAE